MSFKSKTVTVGATATLLSSGDDNVFGYGIAVQVPSGGASVFVGGSNVTASGATKGWEVTSSSPFSTDGDNSERLYAIVASGTQDVVVFERGV